MDSSQVQDSEGLAVIKVLAVVLERLVGANCSLPEEQKGRVTKFHALRAPVIGIGPYLERSVNRSVKSSHQLFKFLFTHAKFRLKNSQICLLLQ